MREKTPLSSIFFQKVIGLSEAPAAEENSKGIKTAGQATGDFHETKEKFSTEVTT